MWEGDHVAESGERFVRRMCPGCGSQLRAPAAQIGRRLPCPKCGHPVDVIAEMSASPAATADHSHPASSSAAGRDDASDDLTYGVRDPGPQEYVLTAVPASGPSGDAPPEAMSEEAIAPKVPSEMRAVMEPPTERRKLPPHPMLDGVLTFFWQVGTIVCWATLSLLVMTGLWMLFQALKLGSASSELGLLAAPAWIGCMGLLGSLLVVCLILVVVASAYFLAILRDTAAGNDRIEEWPEAMFVNWVTECFYIITSLGIPLVIGRLAAIPLGGLWDGVWWVAPLCCWLLFPITMLSTLELQSPLMPVSPAVLRSLWICAGTWGVFYVQTAGMACILTLVGAGLYVTIGLELAGCIVLGSLCTAAVMLYFRLLGRLAWVCDERFRAVRAAEEEAEEAAEEDDQSEEEAPEIHPTPVDDF
jgi:hypothetical protein